MSWKTFVDEVGFLAQYPVVGHAISDSPSPIPGYLFGEINALTFVDSGVNCKPMVKFLTAQLSADSPQVSLKVLKLLLYIVKNGHKEVISEVKIQEIVLKNAAGFHGPPDEFHGHTFYETIRKLAKELLEFVFDENAISESAGRSENSEISEMSGYGSSATNKKLMGFGYTVKTPKTVSEKVTDGLTNLMEKFLHASDETENKSELQSSFLGDSLPQYKPITINKSPQLISDDFASISVQPQTPTLPIEAKRKTKARKVGKPGGGWNSSDEEEVHLRVIYNETSKQSTVSSDSLENSAKLDSQYANEWMEEHQVVDEFTINEPLDTLQCENIVASCKRCSSLNCDKILAFLINKLSEEEENVKLRALLFIEYLLHNDVVNLESLVRIVLPPLQKETLTPNSVQIKSKKVCLIIQSLCKYQNKPLQSLKANEVKYNS